MEVATVVQALEQAFPDLQVTACCYLDEGWDSSAWIVNETLIFRFPKRADVAQTLQREIAVLPSLAAVLPIPIPQFSYVAAHGAPTDPALPFVGYRLLPGTSLHEHPEYLQARSPLVSQLSAFLRVLHAFSLDRAVAYGVPAGSWATWLAHWQAFATRTMRDDDPALDPPTRTWVTTFREAFLAELQRAERPVALLHHDLGLEHILCDPTGELITGIIDWGDLAIGDPAIDFAGFVRRCNVPTLDALISTYGPVDEGFRRRARWYDRLEPFHLLYFGLDIGDQERVAAGYAAIHQAAGTS